MRVIQSEPLITVSCYVERGLKFFEVTSAWTLWKDLDCFGGEEEMIFQLEHRQKDIKTCRASSSHQASISSTYVGNMERMEILELKKVQPV